MPTVSTAVLWPSITQYRLLLYLVETAIMLRCVLARLLRHLQLQKAHRDCKTAPFQKPAVSKSFSSQPSWCKAAEWIVSLFLKTSMSKKVDAGMNGSRRDLGSIKLMRLLFIVICSSMWSMSFSSPPKGRSKPTAVAFRHHNVNTWTNVNTADPKTVLVHCTMTRGVKIQWKIKSINVVCAYGNGNAIFECFIASWYLSMPFASSKNVRFSRGGGVVRIPSWIPSQTNCWIQWYNKSTLQEEASRVLMLCGSIADASSVGSPHVWWYATSVNSCKAEALSKLNKRMTYTGRGQ